VTFILLLVLCLSMFAFGWRLGADHEQVSLIREVDERIDALRQERP